MGQLEQLNDYRLSAWLENGLLTRVLRPSRRMIKAAVRSAVGVASLSAIAVASNVSFLPKSSAEAWPRTHREVREDSTLAEVKVIGERIDTELAAFSLDNAADLDQELLEEARLTLVALSPKA